jgi:hypothetical protein
MWLVPLALMLTNCGQKNDSSSQTTYYAYSNSGLCYQYPSGTQVSTTYCANSGAYRLNASGYCVSTTTGQQVSQTLCQNTGYNNGYAQYTWYNGSCVAIQSVSTQYCQQYGGYGQYQWNNGSCVAIQQAYPQNCQQGYY